MATEQSTPAPDVEYRDTPGFPGYRVGDDGSVWSCWTRISVAGRGAVGVATGGEWVRKTATANENGYLRVSVRNAAGRKTRQYVHRLVLLAFVGPCPDGMECCHGPGGQLNNRPDNLRWGTHADNVQDTADAGHVLKGEAQPNSKLTDSQVLEIRRLRAAGEPVVALARRFGIAHATVGQAAYGVRWKHLPGQVKKPTHKVTAAMAAAIRLKAASGVQTRDLASEFGVSKGTVGNIVNRKGRFAKETA